jgi:CTP synthase
VERLRQIGIQPDILICRTERAISKDDIDKIALFCNVEPRAVIEERDKEFSIYEVPVSLTEHKLDDLIVEKLHLKANPLDISDWTAMLHRMRNPEHEITVGVVGKYIRHNDAYKSVYESLDHAGTAQASRVVLRKIEAEEVEQEGAERVLSGLDGVLVPGGFDYRGSAGKVDAIRYAREKKVPFFGICLGLQCAVIEFARNVVGLANANSTEFDRTCTHPVVCMLDEQYAITDKGGTMRLGSYPCQLVDGSHAHAAYEETAVSERHRHRFEFNNQYRAQFAAHGLEVTGASPNGKLVEIVELRDHPWYLAVQFHPEFKSKPTDAHPLFRSFIGACVQRKEQKKSDSQRLRIVPAIETLAT